MSDSQIMKEYALRYAKLGLAVIPIRSRDKIPITEHGCKDASKDEGQINEWWNRYPDANIGIATGHISNLIVIDEDVDEDKGLDGVQEVSKWERENGPLPDTTRSITGRGGYHLLYRYEGTDEFRNKAGILEGVDIRGEGGYIIAPPSIHPNGNQYQWEAGYSPFDDEMTIAEVDDSVRKFLQIGKKTKDGDDTRKEKFILPNDISAGKRNETIFRFACSLRSQGMPDDSINLACRACNKEQCNPPLDDAEVDRIVRSALTRYKREKTPEEYEENLDKFIEKSALEKYHNINAKGLPTSVKDIALFQDLTESEDILIMGGNPYIYEEGRHIADESGAILKTMIRERILPEFIRSNTIDRVFKLFTSARELQCTYEDMNRYPPWWIPFKDRFYDPKDKKVIEFEPRYRCLYKLPWNYPSYIPTGPNTDKFLRECFDDEEEIEMLFQFFGYCMTRDTRQQKFLIFVGVGGTGKSTLIRILESMIGTENISNISLAECGQRFASYGLIGKVLNTCADLEITALEDTSMLKKILGEDTLRAEPKGKNAFSFKNMAKLVFSTNELPTVKSEKSNGFYRRLLILPMNKVPEVIDTDLFQKLYAEIDYWIYRSVEALGRMYQTGKIIETKTSAAAVEQLRCDSDTVEAFLNECSTKDREGKVKRKDLFMEYEQYCDEQDRTPLKQKGFFQSMRIKGYHDFKTKGEWYFKGITLGVSSLGTSLNFPKSNDEDENPFI